MNGFHYRCVNCCRYPSKRDLLPTRLIATPQTEILLLADMFQPQSTPYSATFSTFTGGLPRAFSDLRAIPPTEVGSNAYSGGPTVFEDRVFPPSLGAVDFIHHQQQQPQNQHQTQPRNTMSEHDIRAQELAAQDYDRNNRIEVRHMVRRTCSIYLNGCRVPWWGRRGAAI